jgi:hypothetical protein
MWKNSMKSLNGFSLDMDINFIAPILLLPTMCLSSTIKNNFFLRAAKKAALFFLPAAWQIAQKQIKTFVQNVSLKIFKKRLTSFLACDII